MMLLLLLLLREESGSPLLGGWGNDDDNGYGWRIFGGAGRAAAFGLCTHPMAPFGAFLGRQALDGAALRAVPQTQFFFSQKYRAIFGDILGNVLRK